MSDLLDDETDDRPDDRTITLKRDQIRSLEKQAKAASEAVARAEAAERRLAFAEAGIPLSDPKMAYFVKGYDGDISPDAIRQAATDAGFLAAERVDDTDQLDRLNRTEAGASNGRMSDDDAYQAEMAAAKDVTEVTAIAAKYGRLAGAQ